MPFFIFEKSGFRVVGANMNKVEETIIEENDEAYINEN